MTTQAIFFIRYYQLMNSQLSQVTLTIIFPNETTCDYSFSICFLTRFCNICLRVTVLATIPGMKCRP